jgi:hypothetical protein
MILVHLFVFFFVLFFFTSFAIRTIAQNGPREGFIRKISRGVYEITV